MVGFAGCLLFNVCICLFCVCFCGLYLIRWELCLFGVFCFDFVFSVLCFVSCVLCFSFVVACLVLVFLFVVCCSVNVVCCLLFVL